MSRNASAILGRKDREPNRQSIKHPPERSPGTDEICHGKEVNAMIEQEQAVRNIGYTEGFVEVGQRLVSIIEKLNWAQSQTNQEIIELIQDYIEQENNYQAIMTSLGIAVDMIIESCISCPGEERCHHDHEDKEKCRLVILGMIEEKQKRGVEAV
jgi:hypothetical protein